MTMIKKRGIILITLLFLTGAIFSQEILENSRPADEVATEAETRVSEAEKATGLSSDDGSMRGETTTTSGTVTTTTTTTTTSTGSTTSTTETTDTTSTTTETTTSGQAGARIYSDGKMTYATSETKFELKSLDQLSSLSYIEYKIDDSVFQTYHHPFSIPDEGLHRIVYRGVDKVGNREPDNVYVVTIDNTGPTVTLSTDKALHEDGDKHYNVVNSKVYLKASDRLSGVQKIEYSMNGGEYQTYAGPITLEGTGMHQIRYRAIDNLGNVSTTTRRGGKDGETTTTTIETFTILVDNTAPDVRLHSSERLIHYGGKIYARRSNTFSVHANDDASGVDRIMIKIDDEADFQPYTLPFNFNSEGNHVIEAKAIDNVGNESETIRLELIVDDNPPRTTIEAVTDEGSANADSSITNNSADEMENPNPTDDAQK